jgi:serine/threonine protein kinase
MVSGDAHELESIELKIGDFGEAKMDVTGTASVSHVRGTEAWMAPEQLRQLHLSRQQKFASENASSEEDTPNTGDSNPGDAPSGRYNLFLCDVYSLGLFVLAFATGISDPSLWRRAPETSTGFVLPTEREAELTRGAAAWKFLIRDLFPRAACVRPGGRAVVSELLETASLFLAGEELPEHRERESASDHPRELETLDKSQVEVDRNDRRNKLGEGTFATCWRARTRNRPSDVAFKEYNDRAFGRAKLVDLEHELRSRIRWVAIPELFRYWPASLCKNESVGLCWNFVTCH